MGKIVRSIAWGYAGAVLAGLVVAITGVTFGLAEETVATAAVPVGILFGMIGLSQFWWRPAAVRIIKRH